MGQHLEFNSSFTPRKNVDKATLKTEIEKRFSNYRDRFNHLPVAISNTSVDLTIDDKVSDVDEIAMIWESFVKEYADFSQGPVSCNRDTDGGTLEWLIGPGKAISLSEQERCKKEIEQLHHKLAALTMSALNKTAEVVTTRPDYGNGSNFEIVK